MAYQSNNPFFVAPADYSQGLATLSQGMQNYGQMQQQKQDRQQQQELQQQQQQQIQGLQEVAASGDKAAVAQYLAENPTIAKNVQDTVYTSMGVTDDIQKEALRNDTFQIIANPQSTEQVLTNRIESIKARGGDPTHTMKELETFKQNPDAYVEQVEGFAVGAFSNEYLKYKAMQRNKEKDLLEQQKYKDERSDKQFDRDIKKSEFDLKKAKAELDKSKGTAKEVESQAKLDAKQSEVNEAKAVDKEKINTGIYTAQQNQKSISDLLNNDDYIASVTGWRGRTPATTDTGVEAEAFLDNVKNSMTIDNLSVMSGPLTDKDIQIIASASSRLREGMSEKALKKELKTIHDSYDRVIKNYRKEANRKGYTLDDGGAGDKRQSQDAIIGGDYSSLWG